MIPGGREDSKPSPCIESLDKCLEQNSSAARRKSQAGNRTALMDQSLVKEPKSKIFRLSIFFTLDRRGPDKCWASIVEAPIPTIFIEDVVNPKNHFHILFRCVPNPMMGVGELVVLKTSAFLGIGDPRHYRLLNGPLES